MSLLNPSLKGGAGGGNRTHTLFRERDFKSRASASSATSASWCILTEYYRICHKDLVIGLSLMLEYTNSMSDVHKHLMHNVAVGCVIAVGVYAAATMSTEGFIAQNITYEIGSTNHQPVYIPEATFDTTLLLQADKEHHLGVYAPTDLIPIPGFPTMNLRQEAATALTTMAQSAEEAGIRLSVISAYRSFATQQVLFAQYSSIYGEEAANTFSARPGYSEHQLGTTIDFGNNDVNDLTKEFENTRQGRWLMENAHYFGFVMSYPEGKEDITGYIYEPWHYRYIGTKYANDFRKSGLTLNQYLARLTQ